MNWLPKHKSGMYLEHDAHKDVYQSIQEYYDPKDFISPKEYEKAIKEDSVWSLQWYPETPIRYHVMAASSLQAIENALKEQE